MYRVVFLLAYFVCSVLASRVQRIAADKSNSLVSLSRSVSNLTPIPALAQRTSLTSRGQRASTPSVPSRRGQRTSPTFAKPGAINPPQVTRSKPFAGTVEHAAVQESLARIPGALDGIPSDTRSQGSKFFSAESAGPGSMHERQAAEYGKPPTASDVGAMSSSKSRQQQSSASSAATETVELTRAILGPTNPSTPAVLESLKEVCKGFPFMNVIVRLGSKSYYRNLALGAPLVAGVLWLLTFVTSRLDSLASTLGHLGASCASPSAAIIAGTWAGVLHTLSGPDHLAALAPLALRKKSPLAAFRTGTLWGLAHVIGQSLLGLCFVAARNSQTVMDFVGRSGIAAFGEQLAAVAVGGVLLAIGALGFKEIHEWDDDADEVEQTKSSGRLRTFVTGMLAGIQPDAILFCLPALALPSRTAGICYLSAFAGASLLAMGSFTAALQAACVSFGQRAMKRVAAFSSVLAMVLGGIICGSAVGVPLLRRF